MNNSRQSLPQRKSIRLKGYDYSQVGFYFITICVQHRQHLFGYIENGKMILNDAGQMVEKWYYELENKFADIQCREMVVMPNHFHCIIENKGEHIGSPLHTVVQWFKTMTTNAYIRGVKQNGWVAFEGKLWQRNYWEHIIRNENEYHRISEYIINNPQKWENDTLK